MPAEAPRQLPNTTNPETQPSISCFPGFQIRFVQAIRTQPDEGNSSLCHNAAVHRLMARAIRLLAATSGALCFVQEAHGADSYSAIRQDIAREIAVGRATGVAVALTQNGKIIWQEGFGWTARNAGDERHRIHLSPWRQSRNRLRRRLSWFWLRQRRYRWTRAPTITLAQPRSGLVLVIQTT